MTRREFIAMLGALGAWPFPADAQNSASRRIGVLLAGSISDPETQRRLGAFSDALKDSGWIIGQNVDAYYRWGEAEPESMRKYAEELVALAPDAILANSSAAVSPLLKVSRDIPIVFTTVADPVGAGYVESLAHPNSNCTGFTNFDYAIGGKWLQLLKEIAPGLTHVGVLREAALPAGTGQFSAVQTAAAALDVEMRPIESGAGADLQGAIAAFASGANGGLIVTGSPAASVRRALIISLAARYRLPTIYNSAFYVADGGLISYGPDFVEQFRRAAGYVGRILNGEKPSDLPVQTPTKYETVINLQTAKELGLGLPRLLLARADRLIG
jgi:putative tryptophan/tyrosine transport system substrate-binding protein